MTPSHRPADALGSPSERRTEMSEPDWSKYVPGARVICVSNSKPYLDRVWPNHGFTCAVVGEVYTIRTACPHDVGNEKLFIRLVEIVNKSNLNACTTCGLTEIEFRASRFRPVKTVEHKIEAKMKEPT